MIDESSQFLQFAAENNKFYSTADEFTMRNNNWRKSHKKVAKLNKKNKMGNVKFADNFTSDLMDDEFNAMLGLDTLDLAGMEDEDFDLDGSELDTDDGRRRLQATAVNWVEAGKVSPVKSQGRCGSCWSFSATTALESMQAITTGEPIVSLSVQEGVDCTTNT